jgi:hypothetical protein
MGIKTEEFYADFRYIYASFKKTDKRVKGKNYANCKLLDSMITKMFQYLVRIDLYQRCGNHCKTMANWENSKTAYFLSWGCNK